MLVWWGIEQLQHRQEERREKERQTQILALRQRYVGLRPDDPTAQELLGDALRQAGFPQEALAALCVAERLHDGASAGAHLASKIRLTRLELTERSRPEQLQQTLQTRETICRRCGTLNLPGHEACTHCGAALLVNGFWETATRGGKMRADLLREVWPLSVKGLVVIVAIACANFLPDEIRFATLIAAIIVVPIVVLRQLGDPTLE